MPTPGKGRHKLGFYSLYGVTYASTQPSIQKIITSISQDALGFLTEEAIHTDAYSEEIPRVVEALAELDAEFSPGFIDQALVRDAVIKARARAELKVRKQDEDVRWLF